MQIEGLKESSVSLFRLKDVEVNLVPSAKQTLSSISLSDLEEIRTNRIAVPASKHGLEAICGASCDTGAQ